MRSLFPAGLITVFIASCFINCSLTSANQNEDRSERLVPCQNGANLSSYFENIGNKTQIILSNCAAGGDEFQLNFNIHISNVKYLLIEANQTATFNCIRENTTITFEKVRNLHLVNVHILNCGGSTNETFTSAVNIINCSNVTIKEVKIANSQRTGLTLVENILVKIKNSTFQGNGQVWKKSENNLPFQLEESKFTDRGGGVQIFVRGNQENYFITIVDCKFLQNSASHGGGLFLVVDEKASGHEIFVLNSTFKHNKCHEGGGGLQIGFNAQSTTRIHMDTMMNSTVKINIQDCKFSSNKAQYGGGVAIFSTAGPSFFSPDLLTFTRCNWTKNSAILGLAVDIAIAPKKSFKVHTHLPSPVFADCRFVKNIDWSLLESSFIVNKPRSTFLVTGYRVEFRGMTVFRNNLGSAIEATAATLNFQENSTVLFVKNKGLDGGAWNIQALSTIYVHDNSYFLFENNQATFRGGAIFVQFADKHSTFLSRSCFLRYIGKSTGPTNLTIMFKNNTASIYNQGAPPEHLKSNTRYRGDSLYITSIFPCIKKCIRSLSTEPLPLSNAFQCTGNITFDYSNHSSHRQISTAASHFATLKRSLQDDNMHMCMFQVLNHTIRRNPSYDAKKVNSFNITLYVVPGKSTMIPLKLVNDLCSEIFFQVEVRVIKSKNMYVHPAHSVITDNYITLYGEENQWGAIQLTTVGVRAVSLRLEVFMDKCPPGYLYNNTSRACGCAASQYRGISRCENSATIIQHGFWIGYVNGTNRTREDRLASCLCPKGYCTNNTRGTNEHTLPSSATEDTSVYICNANRTGLACGMCRENQSVYYFSASFACKPDHLCHLGWLFYILSELIPVTLFFLLVILLNISFTSGPLNGVIFFMQFVDTIKIKAENFIWFEKPAQTLTLIYKFVYRIFSLNFFAIEPLTFCLWSGATSLDILAFKYVTITYSLCLTIITVALLKVCNFNRYVFNLKRSIIHGLSTFLVMSYSECTRISIMIVTRGTFLVGPTDRLERKIFAYYNGEYEYMQSEHLKYAIPAIFFIVTMVSIPPLLLFSYPLCYKLFALLRIQESKCVQVTCKIIPLEKIKPLFDSIQGAFQDQYRFFAGLYFIYRLSSLLTFSETGTLTTYYYLTGLQIALMMTLHAVFRPYKKLWHNFLDALLFLDLFIINGLAQYNYYLASRKELIDENLIQELAVLQAGLILLPLAYLIVYTIYCVLMKLNISKKLLPKKNSINDSNIAFVLEAIDSRGTEESFQESSNYRLLDISLTERRTTD